MKTTKNTGIDCKRHSAIFFPILPTLVPLEDKLLLISSTECPHDLFVLKGGYPQDACIYWEEEVPPAQVNSGF